MIPRRLAALVLALALSAGLVSLQAEPAAGDTGLGDFAYLQSFDRGKSYSLVIATTHGRRKRAIHRDVVGQPSFSPDGKRIAFAGPVGDGTLGRYAIYIVKRNGRGLRRVTSPRFGDFDPAWSPDGRFIAFTRNRHGGLDEDRCCQLAYLRVGRRRVRYVGGTIGARDPAWSPDSKRLVYAAPGGIRVVHRSGRGKRRPTAGWVSEPAWSPDGRRIAYVRHLSYGRSRIETVPATGGRTLVRADQGRQAETPVWGADSRHLYFIAYSGFGYDGRRNTSVETSTSARGPVRRLFARNRNLLKLAYFSGARVRDVPVAGDWNGDGVDTVGRVRRVNGRWRWQLSDRNRNPRTWRSFFYGRADRGDIPVVGDWDGDGVDGVGYVRPTGGDLRWFLSNRTRNARASIRFRFGAAGRGDRPVVGDWDGRAGDGVALVRATSTGALLWRLSDRLPARVKRRFRWGSIRNGDLPIAGNWDSDRHDEPGLVRAGRGRRMQWLFSRTHTHGAVRFRRRWGSSSAGTLPLVGNWNRPHSRHDFIALVAPKSGTLAWYLSDRKRRPRNWRAFRWGRNIH